MSPNLINADLAKSSPDWLKNIIKEPLLKPTEFKCFNCNAILEKTEKKCTRCGWTSETQENEDL